MSNLPDPNFRVYFTPPPALRGCGWLGCAAAIFVIGGIIGVLLFGWKTLRGFKVRSIIDIELQANFETETTLESIEC